MIIAEQLKRCCKISPLHIRNNLRVVVPVLAKMTESTKHNVKHAAQRALVHILAIRTNPALVQGYDGPDAAVVKGLVNKLVKLQADSDDEEGTF